MFNKIILCLTIAITLFSGQCSFADTTTTPSGTYQANPYQIDFNSSEHQLMMAGGLAISITTYSVLGETTDWKPSTRMIVSTVFTLVAGAGIESSRGFNEGRYKSVVLGSALGGFLIPWTFEF